MKQETEGEEKRMEAKAYLEQARNINIPVSYTHLTLPTTPYV